MFAPAHYISHGSEIFCLRTPRQIDFRVFIDFQKQLFPVIANVVYAQTGKKFRNQGPALEHSWIYFDTSLTLFRAQNELIFLTTQSEFISDNC